MKRFIPMMITAILLCQPFLLPAQNASDPVLAVFDKYEDKEGVESVTISPSLLGLMKGNKAGDKKTQELIGKISGLKVLSISDKPENTKKSLREQLLADLRPVLSKEYEQVMKVKSEGDRVELYIRKNAGKNSTQSSALLFITSEVHSVTVMHLSGVVDKELVDAVIKGDIGITN